MRVPDDLRQTVVFLGFEDSAAPGGMRAVGTAFFQKYESGQYLVTAKHVAQQLHGIPFVVRINRKNGNSDTLHADEIHWSYHQDDNVDLAVIPFVAEDVRDYALAAVPDAMLVDQNTFLKEEIGIGDFCYTIGLFRLLAGKQRNLPVVHTGHISLLPGDERVPVRDWDDPNLRRTRHVEGFLVEAQSLSGLSGAPVFVRPTLYWALDPRMLAEGKPHDRTYVMVPRSQFFLLGVWQGAWDAPPDEVVASERGVNVRVPVGMGVVVPVSKLVDLLNSDELRSQRAANNLKAEQERAASLDTPPA